MFDKFQVTINDSTVTGFPAFFIMAMPFFACIFVGILIGAAL